MKAAYALILLLTFSSCGIFKKQKNIQKAEVKKEVLTVNKTDINVIEQKSGISTEVNEITIKRPGKIERDTFNLDNWQLLHDDIIQAIIGSEEVTIRTSKQVDTSYTRADSSIFFDSSIVKMDSSGIIKDIHKDSNTTIAANIPWYAWAIGAIMATLIVWMILKKVKLF